MSQTFSPSRACRLHEVPQWDIEADVLVVGFGASGACAAIEAATSGAKVVLFEAASGSGGASALSGGDMYVGGNGGTLQQNTAGFSDSTEDLYNYLLMAGGPNANEAKVRLYADNSLAHFEWIQAQGVVYKNSFIPEKCVEPFTDDCLIWSGSEEAYPFSEKAKPCPRGHTPQFMGQGAGRYIMDKLQERIEALGVDVRYTTRAQALIADEFNRVRGLVFRSEGQTFFARARKGVILCAGGFVMNREMVKRHVPMLLRSNGPIGTIDDGTGIRMGMSVGGATINMGEGFTTTPWYPPSSLVYGIFVNEQGQRFINEDCYHGRVSWHILQQTGDRIFLLQDNSTYARNEFADMSRVDIASVGESWEEIETELGLPHNSLVSTVNLYNEYAAKGEDPLFKKAAKWLKPLTDGPFVALDYNINHVFYSSFTLGGLDTLPTGQVRTEDGEVIPGLYAAGRTACGLPSWGQGYSSGMSIADCTFFGRQAGINAAKAESLD
jgi:succinate dehydrogenase/fumarate reductase flavoprotein subunit